MQSSTHASDSDVNPPHDFRPLIDRVAADCGNAIWLVGRILIGGIFVQSGLDKLMSLDGFAASLDDSGVPLVSVVAPVGAAVELIAGLAVVVGLGTRYAALALIGFTIVATLIAHRFWSVPPAQQAEQFVQFAKNVAIISGFLFVFVTGGGRFSLDRLWRRAA